MPNKKKWRAIVPAVQVFLLISAAIMYHVIRHELGGFPEPAFSIACARMPIDLLLKINLPLVLFWLPLEYVLNLFAPQLSGVSNTIFFVIFGLFLAMSVVLFWYLFVIEVELRKSGKSLIRSSSSFVEVLKTIILWAATLGSIAYAYWDGSRVISFAKVMSYHPSLLPLSIAEAAIGGLISVAWAVTFLVISLKDVRLAFSKGPRNADVTE